VRRAKALAAAIYPRATHVDEPLPGTFGELLLPHLAALGPLTKSYDDLPAATKKECREALDGKRRLSTPCRELLERGRTAMKGALRATHGAAAGPPAGMRTLSDPRDPLAQNGWLRVQHAARLAAFEMTARLEARDAVGAVPICLDALGLGRDASMGGGLVAALVGSAIAQIVLLPCARALDAAPERARRDAIGRLQALGQAIPSFGAILREDAVYGELTAFGALLDAGERADLPPDAQRILEGAAGGRRPDEGASPQALATLWARQPRLDDALAKAADLPAGGERDYAMDTAREAIEASFLGVAAPDFTALAKRYDNGRLAVEMLAEAARIDLERVGAGDWPMRDFVASGRTLWLDRDGPHRATLRAGEVGAPGALLVPISADPE
jgi:hypothetical protein